MHFAEHDMSSLAQRTENFTISITQSAVIKHLPGVSPLIRTRILPKFGPYSQCPIRPSPVTQISTAIVNTNYYLSHYRRFTWAEPTAAVSSEKWPEGCCASGTADKVNIFLTNNGFGTGGISNEEGFGCCFHRSQDLLGLWYSQLEAISTIGLGLWHHCGTEHICHRVRQHKSSLVAKTVYGTAKLLAAGSAFL